MKAIVLLTACGLAALAGCQVSGEAEVDTTGRPSASAEASTGTGATATAGYTMPYMATRDTEWRSGTDASATTGTLRAGDQVMFNRAPDMAMQWQQARTADGRTVYVRPADFRAAAPK